MAPKTMQKVRAPSGEPAKPRYRAIAAVSRWTMLWIGVRCIPRRWGTANPQRPTISRTTPRILQRVLATVPPYGTAKELRRLRESIVGRAPASGAALRDDLAGRGQSQDQKDQEQHQEQKREKLRDRERSPRDRRKPEQRRDEPDHEKEQGELQHSGLLPRDRRCERRARRAVTSRSAGCRSTGGTCRGGCGNEGEERTRRRRPRPRPDRSCGRARPKGPAAPAVPTEGRGRCPSRERPTARPHPAREGGPIAPPSPRPAGHVRSPGAPS